MKFRSKVLLAKLEGTYGVDSTPTGVDAVQTKNLSIQPYEGNSISRDLDRDSFGAQEQININPHVVVSFEVELAGSGTAGNAPAWGTLIRACGFNETVNASTDVVYKPVSESFPSVTLYFLQKTSTGYQQQAITGCRGSVSFSVDRSGIPVMRYNMMGFYQRPQAVGDITVDRSAYIDPVYVSKENTSLVFGSYTAKASSFSLDMAVDMAMRSVTGDRYVNISDRAPNGSATIDAPELSEKDFFALVESHDGTTTEAVTLTHGSLSGNIIEISGPAVQFTSISPQDSDGELAYQLGMTFLPETRDDDVTITVK